MSRTCLCVEAFQPFCSPSPLSLLPGFYVIECRAFKELLATCAESLVSRLLDQVRLTARSSNIRIHEEYSLMSGEVMKPCGSGEEVLALKKLIQKSMSDQDRLREEIAANKARDEFLNMHR